MIEVTGNEFYDHFDEIFDKVVDHKVSYKIVLEDGKAVALIPYEEYELLKEHWVELVEESNNLLEEFVDDSVV